MTWLLEQPLFIVVIGLTTAAILGGVWIQTGHKALLYALVAGVALTLVALLVERAVTTDREQVEATLHRIARDVERNDLEAVLGYIHRSAPEVRLQAEAEMPRYEFQEVKIKQNLQIAVDSSQQPKKAVAQFNVVVIGSDRDRVIGQRRVPRFVIVTFLQEDGQWRVSHYEHHDPRRGYTKGR